jgi:3-hydroxy-9,10-secoandrosta-1,3,5(10)-triene-9,17-dione monooxygenase reductase component
MGRRPGRSQLAGPQSQTKRNGLASFYRRMFERPTHSPSDAGFSTSDFRHVLGHLPTGVTFVSASTRDEPVGMVANSVTSVSLDPPLILFCPALSSTTWPRIRASRRFCVSVLPAQGDATHARLSRSGGDRFTGIAWHQRAAGPALDHAVAWIDCELETEHVAGDHTIVVALVTALEAAPARAPLVFFRGGYGTVSPAEELR